MSEMIKGIAQAIQQADGDSNHRDHYDVLARAALDATAANIEARFGEMHPGALYIRRELQAPTVME